MGKGLRAGFCLCGRGWRPVFLTFRLVGQVKIILFLLEVFLVNHSLFISIFLMDVSTSYFNIDELINWRIIDPYTKIYLMRKSPPIPGVDVWTWKNG